MALVATVDYIMLVVDDAFIWGRIAAANALSDVHAMGARRILVLNIVTFPRDSVTLEVLGRVIEGGAAKVAEAGVPMVGHSVDDPGPKYGLVAHGTVHPFVAYLLVQAIMLRRRDAAPGAAERLAEHAHALELLADLVRALPEDEERLLLLGSLVVRGGQFAPGPASEHALTQFVSTSREACDTFLTILVQIAPDDALALSAPMAICRPDVRAAESSQRARNEVVTGPVLLTRQK